MRLRRLLVLPAFALLFVGTPVFATGSNDAPAASTAEVPVVAPGQTVAAGWESKATPVDATLVGVTWQGAPDTSFTVEVRDSNGLWSIATPLEGGNETDPKTKDAARVAEKSTHGSEPVWVGTDAQAVRVTVTDGSAADVSIAAVNAQPDGAPAGSAGALGVLGRTLDGPERYVFAALLVGAALVLIALALGWSPWRRGWRSHRRTLVVVAAGALLAAACAPPPPPPPPVPNGDVMPGMITRDQWGARGFACGAVDYAPKLKFAVVHHTVNSNSYGPGDSAAILRGIQAYEMDALGYCDIAYNFLVDRYGQIFEGRAGGASQPVIGGHAGGFNTASTGVALIGDYTSINATSSQWNSLVHLLRWRLSVGRVDPAAGFTTTVLASPCNCQQWPVGTVISMPNAIVGHREVDQTSCPGNTFFPQMGALRDQVQSGIVIPPLPSAAEVSLGAVVSPSAGKIQVVVRNGAGGVDTLAYDGSAWGAWNNLGGFTNAKVAAAATAPGEAVGAVRGGDNAVWANRFTGGAWTGYQSLGGNWTSDPVLVGDPSGHAFLFARGTDKSYSVAEWNGTSWSAWSSLGGQYSSNPAAVVAGSDVWLFGRGTDFAYYALRWSGTTRTWGPATSLGPYFTSDPAAVAVGSDVWLFGRGGDDAYYAQRWSAGSGTWGTRSSLGGVFTSDPAATVVGSDVWLFGRGGDNAYWVQRWSGNAWGARSSLGPHFTSDPAAVTVGSDVWVFGRGGDNALYGQRWNGSWQSRVSLGGTIGSVRGMPAG